MTSLQPVWGCAIVAWSILGGRPAAAETKAVRIPAAGSGVVRSGSVGALSLRADRVLFSPSGRCDFAAGPCPARLRLTGHVAIEIDHATIRAGLVVVEIDEQGAPTSVQASGGVQIALGGRTGYAKQARLALSRMQLVLEGAASLKWEQSFRIDGQRIAIDLRRGQVTVRQARAHFGALSEGS